MDVMSIETPESLLSWADACGCEIQMDKVSAGILLGRCEDRGFHIGTDKEGKLYLCGKVVDTQMELDDVIDLCCDWLYEDRQVARDKMEQTTDVGEYSRWSMDLECIQEMDREMNKLFNQTKYGKSIKETANRVADSVYQRLTYVPVYNIPVVDSIDIEETHSSPQPENQKPTMQVAEPKLYNQAVQNSKDEIQPNEKVPEKRVHEPLPFEPTEQSREEDEYVNPFRVVGEFASTELDFQDTSTQQKDKTDERLESPKISEEMRMDEEIETGYPYMQEAYMPERRGR